MRRKVPAEENEKHICKDLFITKLLFTSEKYKDIALTCSLTNDLFLDRMCASDSSFYY